jgi:hypothetical protein
VRYAGRWNHNSSRVQPVINELLANGFSVQLRHVPTETSWQDQTDHGYVALFVKGQQIVRSDGFQHNVKLRSGGAYDGAAVERLVAHVSKALSAAA